MKFIRLFKIIFGTLLLASCSGKGSFDQYENILNNDLEIPSGSIIITSNSNGTTGPGIISVWTSAGVFDRVIYDYTRVGTGYASGLSLLPDGNMLVVSDTGGGASNDFLDLFSYHTPFATPTNLFSSLVSGGVTTYMRQTALVTDTTTNKYYAFVSESGSNRIARLSSNITSNATALSFSRDFNFTNNGTCTMTTPYGVTYIPSSNRVGVIHSAATGRVNVFDLNGTCIGSTSMTNTPTGSAYHATSNKLLVTYSGNSSITAHDVSTGAANPSSAIYTSTVQLSTPRAIATDAQGYIYVGSDGLDQVIKLYWDGSSATATYLGVIIPTSVFTSNITSITVVP